MDPAIKKTVLRMFTYGLYAVTAKHGDELSMMTVNWITQSSFDPPLLVMAVEQDSHSRKIIEASGAFVVNLYDASQRALAGQLGMKFSKHPEKQTELQWRPSPVTGNPILEAALGWVDCKVVNQMPSGDHVLLLAEVVDVGLPREGTPLSLKDAGFKYAG